MEHQQKLNFVLKMTKHALDSIPHYDAGGTVLSAPSQVGVQNAVNPNTNGLAGMVGGILGTNNQFQASGTNIQQGTNAAQLNNAYQGTQGALGGLGGLTSSAVTGAQQGLGTQNNLTGQLMGVANGTMPTAAQTQLNQATGENIKQAAALAAMNRGVGTNAGLIASNAAQQGANTQQQSVGQGATLAAQEQESARQQLANLAANQVNQGTGLSTANTNAQLGEQNLLQNANTAANNQAVQMQSNINNINSGVAAGNQAADLGVLSGLGSAIGGVGKLPVVQGFLGGGNSTAATLSTGGLGSSLPTLQGSAPSASGLGFGTGFAEGGEIPEHLHGMAKIYHPEHVKNYKAGGKVPGKAKFEGDNYDNDTVTAKLSPGEVVIDRETLADKGKLGKMARFVASNIERKKAGRKL